MATYEEKQQKPNSRKLTLVVAEASKRLMGWVLDSGSIYRIDDFDFSVIAKIEESGNALTEVSSLSSVVAGSFFNDRRNKRLYLRSFGSVNPNSIFVVLTAKNFYSNAALILPHDLSSGKEVEWLPMVKNTSGFGVESDNSDQIGVAVEGGGKIDFVNDREYWKPRYAKLQWENQIIQVYSLIDDLPATEAKKIFDGRIKAKQYQATQVSFTVQDLLSEIRANYPLQDLSEIPGLRITESLMAAKARRIYGRLFGHVATPVDQVLEEGYPLTGTVSLTNGSATIMGSGTLFLKEVSPNDTVIIMGLEFTVEDVIDDDEILLTEEYVGPNGAGETINIKPDFPKPYINRKFKVAGHATRQVDVEVVEVVSLNKFILTSVDDLFPNDEILFGNGERLTINRVNVLNSSIQTNENALLAPLPGETVTKPSVQNLRINNGRRLLFSRDFDYDADTGMITLEEDAEFNTTPTRAINGSLSFTNTLRTVTGTGTAFESQLRPGYWIRSKGQSTYFEVLAIDSDTSLRLRTPATYTQAGEAQYRAVRNFNEEEDTMSCDIVGTTDDGTKEGNLLVSGPEIVRDMLDKAGLSSIIDGASFDFANSIAPYHIGFAIPKTFDSKNESIFRDLINEVNFSILGSLIQTNDFELSYSILRPRKLDSFANRFEDADIMSFTADSDNDRIIRTAIVEWMPKEYNFLSGKSSIQTKQKTSNFGQYITRISQSKTIPSLLVDGNDAIMFANRWAFFLEMGSTIIKMSTKMQGARLQVNDLVAVFYSKLFDRVGGGTRKLSAVQRVTQDGASVDIETEDLSNAFNRVAAITPDDAPDYDESTETQRFFNSFITDSFGMMNNDAETHGLNLIW